MRNRDAIAAYSRRLATRVEAIVTSGEFAVITSSAFSGKEPPLRHAVRCSTCGSGV